MNFELVLPRKISPRKTKMRKTSSLVMKQEQSEFGMAAGSSDGDLMIICPSLGDLMIICTSLTYHLSNLKKSERWQGCYP